MRIKCDYCNTMVDEERNVCPNCGAPLNGVNRFAEEQPKTIEELRAWYVEHNLPSEDITRFYIGKDIKEPRAFGIYQNINGDYVVYKNKSDGTRAVRYQGSDEAYAVNELYQKLKIEIANRKGINSKSNSVHDYDGDRKDSIFFKHFATIFYVVFFVIIAYALFDVFSQSMDNTPANGYYSYEGETYYYQDSAWYYYEDEMDSWDRISSYLVPEEITSDDDGEYAINTHAGKKFEDTYWYITKTENDWSNDWDDDYDWDDDDWDSWDTDWDSDW